MKKSKLIKVLSMLMIISMIFAGCGKSASDSGDANTEPGGNPTVEDKGEEADKAADSSNKKITVVVMALNSDYWHMVEAGALLAGKEFGYDVSVIGPNAESDVIGQINMIEDAITNQVAAIVVAPNEPNAVLPTLKTAKEAGIPVIVIDAAVEDEDVYETFVGTGNFGAGETAGEYLASKLQPGDEVAVIRGLVGQPTHDERSEGAISALEAAGMKVVTVQPADSDRGKAIAVAENVIQTNPNIKCFYATNDEMALGAYQAVEGAQLQDQTIVMGFDGSFGALDSIKEGKLTASLAQKPIEEGYLGVKHAIDVIEGREVEKKVNNGVVVVDSGNVEEFRANIDAQMADSKK